MVDSLWGPGPADYAEDAKNTHTQAIKATQVVTHTYAEEDTRKRL